MKKFVRFFSGVISVLMVAMVAMPGTNAMWPSAGCRLQSPARLEDQLQYPFNRALASGAAAATYCFFNPHSGQFGIETPMEYPRAKRLEDIPVAICLKNDKAKEVFRNYFLAKEDQTFAQVLNNSVDPRENVFVISFADMNNMAYPDSSPSSEPKLALFTRNGILGDWGYRDTVWSWAEVIEKSTLRAEWNSAAAGGNIDLCFRAKIRVLMKGLPRYAVGETTRALYGGKTTEMHFWRRLWTGRDIIVET